LASKRPIPYAKRILHYCERHAIKVPIGFHSRSAYKFALIEVSVTPTKLIAVTWYLESQVVAYLQRATSEGRAFRVFDFKAGRELRYIGERKLQRLSGFAHRAPDEQSAV
jgi:hypothetical protein